MRPVSKLPPHPHQVLQWQAASETNDDFRDTKTLLKSHQRFYTDQQKRFEVLAPDSAEFCQHKVAAKQLHTMLLVQQVCLKAGDFSSHPASAIDYLPQPGIRGEAA